MGKRAVMEALAAQALLEKIFVAYGIDDTDVQKLRAAANRANVPVSTMDRRKFAALERELELERNNAQGVIALRTARAVLTLEQMMSMACESLPDPILVVLDGITDPHNLGAIARSAECAGAFGLILPGAYSAPITPTAVKASAGALEHLQIAKVVRVSNTIRELRANGFTVIGTAAPAKAPYHTADMSGKLAIVIGSEGSGLHPRVLEECTAVVEIPMHGKVESLNASVAAGIILFEAARQRL